MTHPTRAVALALACALLLIVPATAHAGTPSPAARERADSASLHAAASAFLTAFDTVDWERFAAVWATDATVFMPDADKPHRFDGRDTVLTYFRGLFAAARARAGDGKPSLNILSRVRDLRVVLLGQDAGIVTFHLGDDPAPGRRTVVWSREAPGGAWRIVHLHASRLPPPPPPAK